jgi:Tfp pilus assembly protein PilO
MQNDYKNVINKYLSTAPYLTSQKSQKFFGMLLTLCAISIFGLFAIKPTISTILGLQKELDDDQLVLNQMETKIANLTKLKEQYSILQKDESILTDAITIHPDIHLLFAQIQSIAQTSNVYIKELKNSGVDVVKNTKDPNKKYYSYTFDITGSLRSLDEADNFIKTLTSMERIINIDQITLKNTIDNNGSYLGFDIQAIAFFKDKL